MTELVLVVVALLTAAAGYYEAAKLEQQTGAGPWGLTPSVCGLACVVIGFLGAVVFEPAVIGALVGVVGYNEISRYEELRHKRLAGRPARVWAIAIGALAAVAALIASVIAIGGIAVVAALVAGLFLMKIDRDELVEVNKTLRREKDELVAEMRSAAAERSKRPAAPAQTNYSTAVAAARRAEKPKPAVGNVVSLTAHTGGDLLPGRH